MHSLGGIMRGTVYGADFVSLKNTKVVMINMNARTWYFDVHANQSNNGHWSYMRPSFAYFTLITRVLCLLYSTTQHPLRCVSISFELHKFYQFVARTAGYECWCCSCVASFVRLVLRPYNVCNHHTAIFNTSRHALLRSWFWACLSALVKATSRAEIWAAARL